MKGAADLICARILCSARRTGVLRGRQNWHKGHHFRRRDEQLAATTHTMPACTYFRAQATGSTRDSGRRASGLIMLFTTPIRAAHRLILEIFITSAPPTAGLPGRRY